MEKRGDITEATPDVAPAKTAADAGPELGDTHLQTRAAEAAAEAVKAARAADQPNLRTRKSTPDL